MSQQKTIPERSAIPQPDTWNTADLYPTDQAWQEDFVRLQGLTTRLAEYEGRLGGSAAVLYGFLTLEQEAGELLVRLMDYAQRRSDEDTRVPEYQAMVGRITTQYVDIEGDPTMDQSYNPNGSVLAIEGITSPDGRVFGKMGHSERSGEYLYKNVTGDKYQPIFEGGVDYFKV